jgi:predicted ArsR family transcriptional regulator
LKVRQNDEMPRYLRPDTSLAKDIEMAIESLGTIFSRAIVRHLSLHGETGSADLAEALGTDPNTVRRCLKQLEDADLVAASVPIGHRRGRTVLFSVNPQELKSLMKALEDFLLGH